MKKMIVSMMIISIIIFINACGKATVEPQNSSYEPRLVIEGFLQANQTADRIYITKNFTADTDLNHYNLIPDPAETRVILTDLSTANSYELTFHIAESKDINGVYWRYEGTDLIIQPGKTYELAVSAKFEDQYLNATARTTVPNDGFMIHTINYQQLSYRQKREDGSLINFEITYQRSPGTNFYVAAIQALNPQLESFIYDNPYHEIKPEDVNLVDDAYNLELAHHTLTTAGVSVISLGWNEFQFYDEYRIILYAADKNYKDFLISYGNVMEMDGNFHEAKFNIEGDGIGVFGSIIADTVMCRVMK